MIIITHHTGEPHGILGAQVAATFFTKKLGIETVVIGVERQFSKRELLDFIDKHYSGKDRIIGFSHLCGRKDLIDLIGEIKKMGFVTILGGPQSWVDYCGEENHEINTMRFKGLNHIIDLSIQGPVDFFSLEYIYSKKKAVSFEWNKDIEIGVDWSNIYTFSDDVKRLYVKKAQVLNSIGCPYALKNVSIKLPPPNIIKDSIGELEIKSCGCIFCDVAKDKGYKGRLERNMVISQIKNLPEEEGRKIPFEIIDEYPIKSLKRIIEDAKDAGVKLSQIDLVCRVDDINLHRDELFDILKIFKDQGITLMFSSIGFESFNDRILSFLNKGITVTDIITCIDILRRLKEKFKDTLKYRTDEGANHGFIHPTPWDDDDTEWENKTNIAMYRMFEDILPYHSVPLIIHHSSCLGDWIRLIESKYDITFKRDGTWIEWWG